jgi:hypothetical protein
MTGYEKVDQPQPEREPSLDEQIRQLKANQTELEKRISEQEASMRRVHLKIWGEEY